MKLAKATAAIALLALLPTIPYLFIGYSGHDFVFHATSWLELRNAWMTGHFAPGRAAMANFTLGDPHLVLYPPVSFLFGGMLSLLLPFRLVPGAFVWIAFAIAGVSMYVAAKPFVAERDRLPAALLYTVSPYFVTTALVRFAAAELLVQAWLPLILLFFYRAAGWAPETPSSHQHPPFAGGGSLWRVSGRTQESRATLLLGVLLGLTWLTNIPASLILAYGLIAAAAMCCVDRRSPVPILRLLAAEAIAFPVAAVYLLPLWFERAWINEAGLIRSEPSRLLLFMSTTGPETLKTFKYSVWTLAVAGIVFILICLRKRTMRLRDDPAARTWLYLALVSLFFQLPFSLWCWNHLPVLRAAEYPFRFLPFMGVGLSLLLFSPATRPSLRKPICAVVVLLSLWPVFQNVRVQTHASSRFPHIAALVHIWQTQGYAGTAEYWPKGVSTPPTAPALRPDCTAVPAGQSPNSKSFRVISTSPCLIELPVLSYPYWHASEEAGHPVFTKTGPHGLIALTTSAGNHLFHLTFETASTLRTLGAGISFVALLAIVATLTVPGSRKLHGY